MKKNIIIVFAAFMMVALASCSDDDGAVFDPNKPGGAGGNNSPNVEVEGKNMALLEKLTSTNCQSCGQWGWDFMSDMISSAGDNGIMVAVHSVSSSKLSNPMTLELAAVSPINFTPAFRGNLKNKTQQNAEGQILTQITKTNLEDVVTMQEAMGPHLCAGAKIDATSTKVTIKSTAKFFRDMDESKEYYLSAWIIEDNVMETQLGQNGEVAHKNVFRGAANSNLWGVKIDKEPKSGNWFNQTFDIEWNVNWKQENSKVLLVMFSKKPDSNDYEFFNCNVVSVK
jgi:hypothetical protein